jgi:hypothetical protein
MNRSGVEGLYIHYKGGAGGWLTAGIAHKMAKEQPWLENLVDFLMRRAPGKTIFDAPTDTWKERVALSKEEQDQLIDMFLAVPDEVGLAYAPIRTAKRIMPQRYGPIEVSYHYSGKPNKVADGTPGRDR